MVGLLEIPHNKKMKKNNNLTRSGFNSLTCWLTTSSGTKQIVLGSLKSNLASNGQILAKYSKLFWIWPKLTQSMLFPLINNPWPFTSGTSLIYDHDVSANFGLAPSIWVRKSNRLKLFHEINHSERHKIAMMLHIVPSQISTSISHITHSCSFAYLSFSA